MDMSQHVMIISVNLGVWTALKLDKDASRAAAEEAQAGDKNAFTVSKKLVSKELLDPVMKARNAINMHKLERTLPWDDNNGRLLPRKMFQTFMDEHAVLEQEFYDRVGEFVNAYTMAREQAAFRLGSRFNPEDYPHPSEVREKFYCKVEIRPLPKSDDFRVALSADALDTVRQQIEEATAARIVAAQADVWRRIEETVTHFAGRIAAQMEEPEEGKRRAPLHQSTIDNLIHLVNALPALNITNDPNMKALGRKLHTMLQTYNSADALKGKADVCAKARDEVQAIIDEMGGFMKAFAGE